MWVKAADFPGKFNFLIFERILAAVLWGSNGGGSGSLFLLFEKTTSTAPPPPLAKFNFLFLEDRGKYTRDF
jgi:hypothetical protein